MKKSDIYDALADNGVAIINADDAYAAYWRERNQGRAVLTFGWHEMADVRAERIQINDNGQPKFDLITPKGRCAVQLQLIGQHNVSNALAAAAAGIALNLDLAQIQVGLAQAEAQDSRLSAQRGLHGAHIIDDSYNANPLSMQAAINVLAQTPGPTSLVFADMKEMGADSAKLHAAVGEQAKQKGIDRLYCFGSDAQFAASHFGKNAFHFADQSDLIAAIKADLSSSALAAETTILIKGSNSMRMSVVAKALLDKE